jgi:glutathione S-transferase
MLEIYHARNTRSVRVIWLAEEMGIPYALKQETLGRPSDEFTAANPARALPAIVDGELVMSESVAILQYLMEKHGPTPLAPRYGDPSYPAYMQFLIFGEASMAAFLTPLVPTKFRAPEDQKSNFTATAARDMFKGRLAVVDRQLERSEHMAGEAFTAADISVVYALGMGALLGLSGEYPERVGAYWNRVKARPACQVALSQ